MDDAQSRAIGDAISEAADAVGAWVRRVRLDHIASRPLRALPESVGHALAAAQVSAFVASDLHNESSARQALLHIVRERGLRHAHMPGITERGFVAGVRMNYDELSRVGERVKRVLASARMITTESASGTALGVTVTPGTPWFAQLGVVTPGAWGSFPAGALYISPESVRGVFVADASLGEFFGAREGLLSGKEVRFTIERGRIVDVAAPGAEALVSDLRAMLALGANSDRIGLVAIGVNPSIERSIGDASVDQNVLGLHLGIGDPTGKASGATWRAQTCFAACQATSRVMVDGVEIIRDGAFVGPVAPRTSSSSRLRAPMPRSFTPTR